MAANVNGDECTSLYLLIYYMDCTDANMDIKTHSLPMRNALV